MNMVGVIDSHVHVASADTTTYPLHTTGVGSEWYRNGDVESDHLVATMDGHGVARAVVVQAIGAYGFDCRYARDAAARHPDRLVFVGAIDMRRPDPSDELARLAAPGDLRGVRLFGVGGADTSWLTDGRAADVWKRARAVGTTIVVVLWTADLLRLRPLVEAAPDVPVAIDHAGFPDLSGGLEGPSLTPLLSLADLPSVHLKLSSHLLVDAVAAGIEPSLLIDLLAERFGPERLIWGSDYPQTQSLTYGEMLDLAHRAARHLSEASRTAFFGANAARLWWGEP
jgi:predicted TIM-barrel fold metal-dependent hydrolase